MVDSMYQVAGLVLACCLLPLSSHLLAPAVAHTAGTSSL